MDKENLLILFHHIHHYDGQHKIHHCGGDHLDLDYVIWHCACGQHRINKEVAIGHTVWDDLTSREIKIRFSEVCLEGGWHIESGQVEK